MPEDLLATTIASVHDWIKIDIASKIENAALLGAALSCLRTALSRSPPSAHVLKMLENNILTGLLPSEHEASTTDLLVQLLEPGKPAVITFESLQALKAVSHNYPSIMTGFWEQISAIAYRLLQCPVTNEVSRFNSDSWKGDSSKFSGVTIEKCTVAAIKVIDECLRAVSGFKGADDLVEFRLLDIQLMSNITREKRVSSAPSYGVNLPDSQKNELTDFSSGATRWSEIVDKHLPLAINHSFPMVRAAAMTCFAGLTSSVFSVVEAEVQDYILSSIATAALKDNSPSVKSAACRAIGVVATFSHNVYSGSMLKKIIHAIEINTHDSAASVRLTASWTLANICDSLRHRAIEVQLESCIDNACDFEHIPILAETALRLTKDGDKIKSNAVRALGHISRSLRFYCDSSTYELNKISESFHLAQNLEFSISFFQQSNGSLVSTSCVLNRTLHGDHRLLERMVQAFLSCVTAGNVKVQWNVCHALSNLFMNDTLRMRDMPWAPTVYSILLLLLRDSSNCKIRMHAAVALAVPSSRLDYGNSFCDVVQELEHLLETIGSHQSVTPSSFKYKDNLEKQLILTTIHVLGFVTLKDGLALNDFFLKKAQFLEEWFKALCSSLMETPDQPSACMATSTGNRADLMATNVPKELVQKALKSLYDVYESSNHRSVAERFEKLIRSFS
ncbi:hypothetical protein HPP92_008913 [Vanilla planifolia]|uniref:HEAT repeat-containing protein 6 n=1 Tax=Vanilla planifolia TaxID=51239 RepID=A0A835R5L0_VANPL|nr:hypothetical protein HPP92_008913 [Vanilla planifolia]